MNENEYKKFLKRYDKFKKGNLPQPFWDEERQTLEYVYYDKTYDRMGKTFYNKIGSSYDNLHVEKNLVEALANIAFSGFYFPYTCKYFTLPKKGQSKKMIVEFGHTHAHNFETVVQSLYNFPESFKVEEDEKKFYSEQELKYLRRVQKYLLFLGLKDLEKLKPSVERFRNKRHRQYGKAYIYSFNKETIEFFLMGKRNFVVQDWYPEYNEKSCRPDYYALFVDKEDNFKMYVKFFKFEVKKYGEVKDAFQDEFLNDDDKLIIKYFKVLKIF